METNNLLEKNVIHHDKVLIESESQTTQIQNPALLSFQRAQKKYREKPESKEKNRMYVKNHYEKNKEAVMEKRRKKLAEYPEYAEYCRKKSAESSRKYREKKKLEKTLLLEGKNTTI